MKTSWASMDAEARKRAETEDDATDISASVTGKRVRARADVAGNLDGASRNLEKRRRVGGLQLAFVAEKETVGAQAQWRNPELKSR